MAPKKDTGAKPTKKMRLSEEKGNISPQYVGQQSLVMFENPTFECVHSILRRVLSTLQFRIEL
jgi:hypothetical protein